MKKRILTVLFPVVAASLCACSSEPAAGDQPAEAGVPPAASTAGATSGMAYPDLYRDMDLPELPGGNLTSTGRQTSSLSDGLALRVETAMPVAEVRDYYSTALGELGWEESPTRGVPGAPMAGLHATKDGVTYMATITRIGDATQVAITLHD
ncbi:MAG: hypothetical protein O2930_12965 [Acidobacteria bacterium]|nr:hypothetical protein [Acidobacteriota bacterium]